MLDCIKGQLLRRSKSEESDMKINILLCDDDNFFCRDLRMQLPANHFQKEPLQI